MNFELYRQDCFHLEIDGISAAGFLRCAGLASQVEVLEFHEGGGDGALAFPAGHRAGRLVLERGEARDRSLWEWFQRADPRAGAVILLDPAGKERMRWNFEAGWPCRWEGPELDASGAGVAVERVEIVHEGLEWQAD